MVNNGPLQLCQTKRPARANLLAVWGKDIMGYAVYTIDGRDCGYPVPALCDYPDCDKEIDRGMSYCCGGAPYSEQGCHLYFCETHLMYVYFINDNGEHEMSSQVCDTCAIALKLGGDNYKLWPAGYEPKPDLLKWILWKLHDASWQRWRDESPQKVKELQATVDRSPKAYVAGVLKTLEPDMEQNQ